jgi:hypothetical protein
MPLDMLNKWPPKVATSCAQWNAAPVERQVGLAERKHHQAGPHHCRIEVEVAVNWLKLRKPDEPVPIAVTLGKHGGTRKG